MQIAFNTVGLNPVSQYTVGPFILDFAFPDNRLAVECDGVYWHNLPKQKIKDEQKDDYLSLQQWRIVRLSEAAIKASPGDCANIVIEALNEML